MKVMMRSSGRVAAILWVVLLLPCVSAHAQHISFDPAVSIPIQVSFEVDLNLATLGAAVQGLDFSFTYDPDIVQLDAITAGGWLTGSGPDHFLWIDPLTPSGAAHVSASLLGAGSSSDGTVLILSFTALDAGISPLHFLAMDLRDDTNTHLTYATHSTGDLIVIEEAIPNEARTMGAVKSLWR